MSIFLLRSLYNASSGGPLSVLRPPLVQIFPRFVTHDVFAKPVDAKRLNMESADASGLVAPKGIIRQILRVKYSWLPNSSSALVERWGLRSAQP